MTRIWWQLYSMAHGWIRWVYLYQREGKKGRHPPAFLWHMGNGLHSETGLRVWVWSEIVQAGRRLLLCSAEVTRETHWPVSKCELMPLCRPLLEKEKRSQSQFISPCFRLLCHTLCKALRTWSWLQLTWFLGVSLFLFMFSNQGRGNT